MTSTLAKPISKIARLRSPASHATICERYGLARNGNGLAYPNLANVEKILTMHPDFADAIHYDEFHERIFVKWDDVLKEFGEAHCLQLTRRLQDEFGLVRVSDDTVDQAVRLIAHTNTRHEVREYLDNLTWDGKQRMAALMVDGFGAANSDYALRVGQNLLLSMIARAYRPGCKVDTMVVLEGAQGTFKSSALKIIGGKWYGELHEAVGTKDAYLALSGKWLLEIAELSAFSRADVERLKAQLSCAVDRYRAPYGRRVSDHPRGCVFVGTTNKDAYLRDSTGARRFWPIRCGHINLEWLGNNREQLLAEAVAGFKTGASWWEVPKTEAEAEQELRREVDPWEAIIADWLIGKNDATASEVLSDCLKIEAGRQDRAAMMRVGGVLRRFGWQKFQRGSERVKAWRRPL